MMSISAKSSIEKLKTYKPNFGKSKLDNLIRLSANEGALGTSLKAIKAVKSFSTNLHRYPPQVSEDLKISYPDKLTFNVDLYRRFCVELKKINNETLLSKILFRALRYLKK